MICLNSQGLPLLEELKNLRAETEITLDKDQEMCSDKRMDKIDKIRKIRSERAEQLKETITEYQQHSSIVQGVHKAYLNK